MTRTWLLHILMAKKFLHQFYWLFTMQRKINHRKMSREFLEVNCLCQEQCWPWWLGHTSQGVREDCGLERVAIRNRFDPVVVLHLQPRVACTCLWTWILSCSESSLDRCQVIECLNSCSLPSTWMVLIPDDCWIQQSDPPCLMSFLLWEEAQRPMFFVGGLCKFFEWVWWLLHFLAYMVTCQRLYGCASLLSWLLSLANLCQGT